MSISSHSTTKVDDYGHYDDSSPGLYHKMSAGTDSSQKILRRKESITEKMRKLSNMDIHDFTQQNAVKIDAFHSYDKTNTGKLKEAVG
jgi:hypothetical protein